METIQKLRSLINSKIDIQYKEHVKYRLRTVSKERHYENSVYGYSVLDIEYIEIDESIRGKGIGKLILDIIIECLFENGTHCILITANDKFGTDMEKLVGLYESLGFTQIPNGLTGSMYNINPNTDKIKAEKIISALIIGSNYQKMKQMVSYYR